MADDIQSNIRINIDTANAMDSIRLLQNQISAFHTQMAKMGAASVADAKNLQNNLINSINATGAFTANLTRIKTTAESFTTALEKNKLTMGEYFRYAAGASKTFGKYFKTEFDTINKVARERVKDLQTQYIKLGRDANGAMQAIKVRPLALDMQNLGTRTQIAAQRQQLLNQLLKQGSTNLLNFGKNTQWAGRQLMVGFTIPLSIMGSAAMKAYQQIEEASIKLKRVYGDLGTTNVETEKMVKNVQQLALEYTKYGVAVKDTMDMAASAAATGKKGADLLAQVSSANKLAVLGGVDQQKALQTTISLTNAFNISSKDLAKNINFLNAVENQTVLNIDDMTTAIPKAAPVIQQLGGDVRDLAFFLTAMKEGGVNASEGANALKSGLASLINPTNTASKMLAGFGINIKEIIEKDKGNLKKTVIDFAKALDTLDPLNRARAIEQLFGKFQFSRMSTLFKNVIAQGSQASEVLKLTGQSSLELAMLSQKELNKIQESPLYKFQKALADFQAQLAPIGEQFMKAITPLINFGTDVLKNFNNLGDGVKQFIIKFVSIAGIIGPVLLMSFGLIANAVANVIKGFALVKDIFNKTGKSSLSLGEQVRYMTSEQIQAAAIASSLDQVHSKLRQTFTSEAAAVDMLTSAYERQVAAQRALNVPIIPRGPLRRYSSGGVISGPGTGTSDSIPAMLSNGEAVIPARSVSKYPELVNSLINNNLPGYANGGIIGRAMENARGIFSLLGGKSATGLDPRIAFKVADNSALESLIKEGQYKNMFHGVRSAAGDTIRDRQLIEQATMGIPLSAGASRRPVYGFLTSAQTVPDYYGTIYPGGTPTKTDKSYNSYDPLTPEQRAQENFLRLINPNNRGLQSYGGATLYLKPEALARASVSFGDTLTIWDQALKLGKKIPLVSNLLKTNKSSLAKKLKSSKDILNGRWAMPYIEAHIPGGFSMQDVEKIGIRGGFPSYTIKRMQEVQQLLNENGLGHISVFDIGAAGQNAATVLQESLKGYASGGIISGPGNGTSDSILARVSNGEAIIPAASVARNSQLVKQLVSGNIPGFRRGRLGSGASGRIGKSGMSVVRPYGANVSNTAGLVDFLDIDANNLADVSSLYSREIIKEAGTSANKINAEVRAWRDRNIIAIKKATSLVDSGVSAEEAFAELSQKFKTDMEQAQGPVHQFTQTAEQMLPKLSEDLVIAQTKARQLGLNVRKAADASALEAMLPNNIAARGLANPGAYMPYSAARSSASSIFGGISEISKYGIPRFMLPVDLHPSSLAYKLGTSQEHVSQTLAQEQNLAANRLATQAGKNTIKKLEDSVIQGMTEEGQMRSPSRKTKQKGVELVQGTVKGIESGIGDATAAGAQIGRAVATGARRVTSEGPFITPRDLSSTQAINARGRGGNGRVIALNGYDPITDSYYPPTNTSPTNSSMYGPKPATKFQQSRLGKFSTKYNNFFTGAAAKVANMEPGKFQGKMFGASMGLGAASMFLPGELGQIAQIGSMVTGVAGMFKNLGPVVARLIPTFGKLIPYVGAAITAYELFNTSVMPLIKKNADALNGIAETLNVTQDKIKSINDFFGTDLKLSGIRASQLATGEQTMTQAAIAKEFQQSQGFKDNYQQSAEKMKDLSNEEFTRAMQAMAADLFGQGADKDLVKTIIDAIALEANKTSVKILPKMLSLKNTEATDLMQKNLKTAFSQVAEGTSGISPMGISQKGRTLSAGKGEFDNWWLTPVDPSSVAKVKAGTSEIASYMSALSGQFANGEISSKQFNLQYEKLISLSKQQPGTSGIESLKAAFISLNSEVGLALQNLNNIQFSEVSDAILAGVTATQESMNVFNYGTDKQIQQQVNLFKEASIQIKKNRDQRDLITKKIKGIQSLSQDVSNIEQKINDKYDKRIAQIEKIKKLNDQIAKTQQGQLDLAQALNEGDISAAARAAEQIQQNNVQNALDQQQAGLEDARKAELKPLQNSQSANTLAIQELTKKIETLSTEGITVKTQNDFKNTKKQQSRFGNDALGWIGWYLGQVTGVTPDEELMPGQSRVIKNGKVIGNTKQENFKLTPWFATGGHITGPGTGTSDSIPAMLSNGEYVIRANAVKKIGVNTLDKLNQADRLGFASGGMVSYFKNGGYNGYSNGGKIKRDSQNNDWQSFGSNPITDWIASGTSNTFRALGTVINPWSWFMFPDKKKDKQLSISLGQNNKILKALARANNKPYNPVTANFSRDNIFGIPNPYLRTGGAYSPFMNAYNVFENKDIGVFNHEFGHALDYNLLPNLWFGNESSNPIKNTVTNPFLQYYNTRNFGNKSYNSIAQSPASYLEEARAQAWKGVLDRLNNRKLDLTEYESYASNERLYKSRNTKLVKAYNVWDAIWNANKTEIKANELDVHPDFGPGARLYMGGFNDPVGYMKMLGLKIPKEYLKYKQLVKYYPNFTNDPLMTIPKNISYSKDKLTKKFPYATRVVDLFKGYSNYANGGLVGYKDGGKPKPTPTWNPKDHAAHWSNANITQEWLDKVQRDKLYKKGGAQGFEAGFNSWVKDITQHSWVGDALKAASPVLTNPVVDTILSTFSLPVNIVGAAVNSTMNKISKAQKGDWMGAIFSPGTELGDAFASTYGHVFDKNHEYKSQFEVAAQNVIKNGWFGTKGNKEQQAWARIIGGGLDIVADPTLYLGGAGAAGKLGLASKVSKIGKGIKEASQAVKGTKTLKNIANKFKKPVTINKEIGDNSYPTFDIAGQKFAFQGYGQDFSKLSNVNIVKLANNPEMEVAKGFVGASAPTPVALLEAALKLNPGNKKLQRMLNNFKQMKIGKPELKMLDNIAASISIDSKMKPLSQENTEGFATMLSSLAGNLRSKSIINKKTNTFNKIMKNKLSSKQQQERDGWASYIERNGEYENVADPSSISMIHSSKHPIVRDKYGNIHLYPLGQFNPVYARPSIHFTTEAPVQSHMLGKWDASENKIVSPLSLMINDNGLPANLYPLDTWWMRNPGQSLKISNASVIRPFKDYKAYSDELVSRGLIEPGKMAPVMMIDPKTKDILYMVKPQYSFVDRLQIQKLREGEYNRFSQKYLRGKEFETLNELSLELAKKQLGTDLSSASIGEHSLYPQSRQSAIQALAQRFGISSDRYHYESNPHDLLSYFGSHDVNGIGDTSSTKFSDYLESLKMRIMKGHFVTRVDKSSDYMSKFPKFAERFSGGGIVKRNGPPNPFIDPMGWLQGLINGMFAGGGNPSGYLDNTAAKGIQTGAKSTLGFYKDYIFDPSNPVDYAMALVPGSKIIKKGVKVAKDISKGTSITTDTAKELVKAKLFASSVNVPTVEEILKNRKPNDFTVFKQFKEILDSMNVAPEVDVALDTMKTSRKYLGASVNNRGVRKGVETPVEGFYGHFIGPDGSEVGKFSTKMFKNPATGKSILQDVHIELDSKYHGKGIGKNFTLQAMELFKKAGVNEINIDAGLSHGGAAWAKAGFKFSKRPWDVLARAQFIAKYIKDENLQKVIKQLESKFSRNKYISPMDILNLKKIVSPEMVKKIGKKSEDAYLDDIGGYGMMLDDFIPTSVIDELPKNVKPTIGNLIMYGSNWEGFKTLNKAKGGLIDKYANGGYVMPSPEPPPTQFANGGMVPKAAIGGMLLNGKFFGGFSNGGMVPAYLAQGGFAMGTDTVPAMLTPGEFVIKKSAVDRIGSSTLNQINRYADGGLVGGTSTDLANSVYNNTYEINVNVRSDANPDQIARAVLTQIKQIDNHRVRGSVI